MHAPPPVAVRSNGGLAWRGLQALLPALASGALAVWGLQRAELEIAAAWAAAAAGGLAGWWRARPRAVDLVWDGQRWTADDQAVVPQLMIDLGAWMLLRLQAAEAGVPTRWLACSAAVADGDWHALRTALYSRPSAATPSVRPSDRAAD